VQKTEKGEKEMAELERRYAGRVYIEVDPMTKKTFLLIDTSDVDYLTTIQLEQFVFDPTAQRRIVIRPVTENK
jgi:hypothetical protein